MTKTTSAAKATKAPARKAPAKKAAARKAPARKAAPAKAATPRGPVDEQGRPAVVFHGRTIAVTRPTDEQIGVWTRTVERFDGLQAAIDAAPTDEARAAARARAKERGQAMIGRLSSIVHSVIVEEADRDWLDDQLVRRRDDPLRLTYEQAFVLMRLAVDRLVPRQAAPTTGPVARLRA